MSTSFNPDELMSIKSEVETLEMPEQASETDAKDGSTGTGAAKPVAGGMLRPFKVRNFNLLFGGQTVSTIGNALYAVALPWLILNNGGSATA